MGLKKKKYRMTLTAEQLRLVEKALEEFFLLRLGFIGNEYKAERKILLKNLSGNSSWKNGAPEKAESGGRTTRVPSPQMDHRDLI